MTAATFLPVRAVLFDLDGTLIDSAPDLAAAADGMRVSRGLPPKSLEAYRPHAGSGARGMLHVAFGIGAGHADYDQFREEFFLRYEACLTQRTRPFGEVEELLLSILNRGLLWGIVTNKAQRFADPIVRSLRLFDSASTVVCGDTTAFAKPHPEPLLEAARQLSLSPAHCIYVGDDERDIVAGRCAGMRTVAASYGYLGHEAHVASWGADAEVSSPLQVLQLLEPS
jgi:N-acetyl-D-muramate 6-phosphate phosphatase